MMSNRVAKYRRLLAALLLAVVVSPAMALIPLGFGIGIVTGIAASGLVIPTILATAAIGTVVGILSFHDAVSTPNQSNQVISAMINPKIEAPKRPPAYTAPLATPPGWDTPTQGTNYAQPTPPTPVSPQYSYSGAGFPPGYGDTLQAACMALVGHSYTSGPNTSTVKDMNFVAPSTCNGHYTVNGSGNYYFSAVQGPLSCKSGYTVSGQQCVLSNINLVQKPSDGHCTIIRSGNTFSADPLDSADCVGASGGTVTISGDSKSVTATRADGSKVEMRTQDDGSVVVVDTQNLADGNTQKNSTNISSPNVTTGESKITGKATEVLAGQGTAVGSGTVTQSVTFDKTGLATSAGQAAIQSSIDSGTSVLGGKLDGIKDGIDALGGEVPGDGVHPGSDTDDGWADRLDAAKDGATQAGIKESFQAAWGFGSILPQTGSCSPTSASVMGQSVTLNFCPAVEAIRSILGWIMYIGTAWASFRVLTRAY